MGEVAEAAEEVVRNGVVVVPLMDFVSASKNIWVSSWLIHRIVVFSLPILLKTLRNRLLWHNV